MAVSFSTFVLAIQPPLSGPRCFVLDSVISKLGFQDQQRIVSLVQEEAAANSEVPKQELGSKKVENLNGNNEWRPSRDAKTLLGVRRAKTSTSRWVSGIIVVTIGKVAR